jgi:hypothetical protein
MNIEFIRHFTYKVINFHFFNVKLNSPHISHNNILLDFSINYKLHHKI